MEEKYTLAEDLLSWVEEQSRGQYQCERYESENSKGVLLKTEHAEGQVNIVFLNYTIVEYRIKNSQEENVFYLHFELVDPEHARELFTEMRECLLKQKDAKTKQILLCCTCGLTTSFFTMKLNEAAELLGTKMEFEAVPYELLYEKARDKDVILIAPQMGYRYKNVCEVLPDKLVMKIPVHIFSAYDVAGMITLLTGELAKQEEAAQTEKDSGGSLPETPGSLLIVSVINMEGRNQIAYRVYDNGVVTAGNQITKQRYSFQDIIDVIQTVLRINDAIETICIVTPGMTNKGTLTYESAGIFDLDVAGVLKEKFGKDTYLFNDTDMIALGYAKNEKDGQDIAFYFVPTGSHAGNVRIVAGGKLIRGASLMGGSQLDSVTNITTFPMNPYTLARTPEGNVELAARYLTGLYSYTGIGCIAFYSSMIPNVQELKDKMELFIRKEHMPEIIKVDSVRNYLYDGVRILLGNKE